MKTAILKGVGLLFVMVGCEAEAPAVSREARSDLTETALRAEKALERSGDGAEAPACRRSERVIYACNFGDRRVAVCANDNRLSYRFGDARRTDLEIDSRPGHVRAHTGGVVGGGGGRQEHIRFSNNGYQYIVHSMVAGDLTDVRASASRASPWCMARPAPRPSCGRWIVRRRGRTNRWTPSAACPPGPSRRKRTRPGKPGGEGLKRERPRRFHRALLKL